MSEWYRLRNNQLFLFFRARNEHGITTMLSIILNLSTTEKQNKKQKNSEYKFIASALINRANNVTDFSC